MVVQEEMSLEKKLEILGFAAKYDVACTSSGVDRAGNGQSMGNAMKCGICHSFSADGRCISLLKVLMTNECIFECKYCINRAKNDVLRATFAPEEVAQLTMEFYRRNYIEGLFLSSGIYPTPDAAAERMLEAIALLRLKYRFAGYIHVKAIPGADSRITEQTGWLADRMSVNLELPTAEGLRSLAPNKTRKNILTPMRQIQLGIAQDQAERKALGGRQFLGGGRAYQPEGRNCQDGGSFQGSGGFQDGGSFQESGGFQDGRSFQERGSFQESGGFQDGRGFQEGESLLARMEGSSVAGEQASGSILAGSAGNAWFGSGEELGRLAEGAAGYRLARPELSGVTSGFVPAGQSTQMIIGATGESDYQIMAVTEQLYRRFDLKRVFYSSFINVNQDSDMPDWGGRGQMDREHRLYQADFLLRYYQFRVEELLTPERPNFNMLLDPKCDFAVRHLELFPVEINRADYHTLLRVPGIGVKSAKRIVAARRTAVLDFMDLKKLGVVMKRAVYFITCKGKMMYPVKLEEDTLTRYLLDGRKQRELEAERIGYRQLSLFDFDPNGPGWKGAAAQ